jgi:hypothetical protein
MTAIATKVRLGTAACAIAAAAALTPAGVAQADPAAPAPLVSQGSLGGSAGAGAALISPDCVAVGGPDCTNAPTTFASPGASASGPGTIFQNRFYWFGASNPTPPPGVTLFELRILPNSSWFANLDFEACVLGATLKLGPYGTVSGSFTRGCASKS